MKENKVLGTICNETVIQSYIEQTQKDNIPLIVIRDEIDFSTDLISSIRDHQEANLDLMVVIADHVSINKSIVPELLNVKWM